jgi:rubrerythrin
MAKDAKAEGYDDIAKLFSGVGQIEKLHEERYQDYAKNLKAKKLYTSTSKTTK